jgi:hypothetical protein
MSAERVSAATLREEEDQARALANWTDDGGADARGRQENISLLVVRSPINKATLAPSASNDRNDLERNSVEPSNDLKRNIVCAPGEAARSARRAAYENALRLNRRASHAPLLTAQLGAVATLLFEGIPHSIALFTMGESASGKSEQLKAFTGADGASPHERLHRVDEFTAAGLKPSGFRNDMGDVRKDKDALYVKVQHRVMVTSELSGTFRGNPHALETRFSLLAKWLDGDGYVLHNGTHGEQGIAGDYTCVWLGATTPFKLITWETMAQLGTRLLFFPMGALPKSEEVPEADLKAAADDARKGVRGVLDCLFSQHKPRTLKPWPTLPPAIDAEIDRLTTLLAVGHTVRTDAESLSRPKPLHFRSRIKEIVAGVVWVTGRLEADESDLRSVVRPLISRSVPQSRGPVLLALHDGLSKVKDIVEHSRVSPAIVARTLYTLKHLDVVRTEGESLEELRAGRPSGCWFLRKEEDDE